jgi:transcription termination/antitermination protein NusG
MAIDEPRAWFALQVRPRFESSLAEVLASKGVRVYLPLHVELRRWSDRVKPVQAPLFPGYVFCHIGESQRRLSLASGNAIQFVGVGKTPLPIDEEEMKSIRLVVDSGLPKSPWDGLKKGDRVKVICGPLAGVDGILLSTAQGPKLIVSLSLLSRSVAVQVNREWVMMADRLRMSAKEGTSAYAEI